MFLVGFVVGIAAANLTSEDFLKPVIGEIIGAQTAGMPVGDQYQRLLNECDLKGTENINSSLETDEENFTIRVNCNALKTNGESEIKNIFKNQVTNVIFYNFYNKKVCSGYSCINMLTNLENPFDVVTADFNKFLKDSLWIIGVLAGLFGLLVIFLAKSLHGKLTSIGGSLITAGLPYFMIKVLGKNIGSMIPAEAAMAVPFIITLLTPIANIFLLIFIVGVVCSVAGFGIKIYRKSKEKKGKK